MGLKLYNHITVNFVTTFHRLFVSLRTRGLPYPPLKCGTWSCSSLYPSLITFFAFQLNLFLFSFTWDTPICKILGDTFQLYNAYLTEKTTLRDILSHKTGIPDYFLGLMAGFPENETMATLVKSVHDY